MTNSKKIQDQNLKCNIDRTAAKIFALSLNKTVKCEYLPGKEVLSQQRHKKIDELNFHINFLNLLEK